MHHVQFYLFAFAAKLCVCGFAERCVGHFVGFLWGAVPGAFAGTAEEFLGDHTFFVSAFCGGRIFLPSDVLVVED